MSWTVTEITRLPNCKPHTVQRARWQHEDAVELAFQYAEMWGEHLEMRPINDDARFWVILGGYDKEGNEIKTIAVSPNEDHGKGLRLLPSWAQQELKNEAEFKKKTKGK